MMTDRNCPYCGVLMDSGGKQNARTRDHFYPLSRGGKVTIFACRKCNEDKASLSPTEWLAALRGKADPRAENVSWFLATHAASIDEMEAAGKPAPMSLAAQMIAWELSPYIFSAAPFDECTYKQQLRLVTIANTVLKNLIEAGVSVVAQKQEAA